MIDSHCHLADEAFAGDLDDVVLRARESGLTSALCVLSAGDERESAAAARVRDAWPSVVFSTGVHPHNAGLFAGQPDRAVQTVRQALTAEAALAIGEIGLDYHYDFSPRDVQQAVFGAQVRLARQLSLPIIIHTREATADTLQILRDEGQGNVRGVFHCFTGDAGLAKTALDLGFFISFSGIVTFPRATELREIAQFVPADRLLAETDSPYLAPTPHRGKRNEPAFVVRVIAEMASVRGTDASELAAQVTRNFAALFGPTISHQTA
jgi:TatD DNase family protein